MVAQAVTGKPVSVTKPTAHPLEIADLTACPAATYSREFDSSSKLLTEQSLREFFNAFCLGSDSYISNPGNRLRISVRDRLSDSGNEEADT